MEKHPIEELLRDARETYGVFGKTERALEIVDRALDLDPQHVDALNLKASILYEMDRDDEAREYHQRALAVEANSVEALHGLAALANDQGKYVEANEWALRAMRAIPLDPYTEFRENEDYRQRLIAEAYNERAFALWYLNQKEEAMRILTTEGPEACPMEVETFEDQLDWLQDHPDSPDDEE